MGFSEVKARNYFNFILIFAAILTTYPIIYSPLTADDIPNSTIREGISKTYGNFISGFFPNIAYWNQSWMHSEGRFFPGAMLYGQIVHGIFQGKGAYKLYLAILGIVIFVLLWLILNSLFNNSIAFIGTLVSLGSYSLRYKYFHDGISSFAGQVPFTGALWLGSLLLGFRKSRTTIPQIIAIFLYVWALLTYEHVLLFLPATLIIGKVLTKKLFTKFSIAITLISAINFAFILYLRSGVQANVAYSTNFELSIWINTTFRQIISAIPSAQTLFSGSDFIGKNTLPIMCLFMFFLITLLFSQMDFLKNPKEAANKASLPIRSDLYILFAGLNLLLLPAIITGATKRWQAELPSGQGYLCVTLQSIGLALAVSALTNHFKKSRFVIAGVVLFLVSINIVWNLNFNS